MSNTIFIIKNDYETIAIYDNLEKAKNELKNIYNRTTDYKYEDFHICVYNLMDNEYINSNIIYTYYFDTFSTAENVTK